MTSSLTVEGADSNDKPKAGKQPVVVNVIAHTGSLPAQLEVSGDEAPGDSKQKQAGLTFDQALTKYVGEWGAGQVRAAAGSLGAHGGCFQCTGGCVKCVIAVAHSAPCTANAVLPACCRHGSSSWQA